MIANYRSRHRVKIFFFVLALLIIGVIFVFLNRTIRQIRVEERQKVLLWAEAVQRRNSLLEYTSNLFEKLKDEELQKVELWRESQQLIMEVEDAQFLNFLLRIISANKNIPIILTDAQRNVISTMNLDEPVPTGRQIPPSVVARFSKYRPLQVSNKGTVINYLYYSDSQIFNELQEMINDMIHSFIVEIVQNAVSVPVIITDSDTSHILAYGNISEKFIPVDEKKSVQNYVQEKMSENVPIQISLNPKTSGLIFYQDSVLISELMYYPLMLLIISVLLALIAYFTLRSFEKHEKDQLWVGMSKETAHQLGTPISSLMAWIEILKMKETDPEIVEELSKDASRLETIAGRFSKIGSNPDLTPTNLVDVVRNAVNYMANRSSKNVKYEFKFPEEEITVNLNESLIAWVIENIWKNAVDAMQGVGKLTVEVSRENDVAYIDVTDTGKGLPRSKFKTIFQPGYTTKTRGWGLGLSLAQRIVKEYHDGKIIVKNSEIDKGTTMRICLPISRA